MLGAGGLSPRALPGPYLLPAPWGPLSIRSRPCSGALAARGSSVCPAGRDTTADHRWPRACRPDLPTERGWVHGDCGRGRLDGRAGRPCGLFPRVKVGVSGSWQTCRGQEEAGGPVPPSPRARSARPRTSHRPKPPHDSGYFSHMNQCLSPVCPSPLLPVKSCI